MTTKYPKISVFAMRMLLYAGLTAPSMLVLAITVTVVYNVTLQFKANIVIMVLKCIKHHVKTIQ